MKDRAGKAVAINVVTPVAAWKVPIVRVVFWAIGRFEFLQRHLKALSFIHFARWTVVRHEDLGYFRDGLGHDDWRWRYLLFNSNFNGPWEEYIDAFSYVLPGGLDLIWSTSEGYPGASPITPFKAYIRHCEFKTDAYYCAYPTASTRDVRGALEVAEAMSALADRMDALDDEAFLVAYDRMLWSVQTKLGAARGAGAPAFLGDVDACGRVSPGGG
jgi:hypothetical protein